jgi:hypothetical protein
LAQTSWVFGSSVVGSSVVGSLSAESTTRASAGAASDASCDAPSDGASAVVLDEARGDPSAEVSPGGVPAGPSGEELASGEVPEAASGEGSEASECAADGSLMGVGGRYRRAPQRCSEPSCDSILRLDTTTRGATPTRHAAGMVRAATSHTGSAVWSKRRLTSNCYHVRNVRSRRSHH